jgi:integrase
MAGQPSRRAEHARSYELLIEKFIRPTLGDLTLPKLARLGPQVFERLYADLSRCRRRCNRRPFIEHHPRCRKVAGTGDACNAGCKPHECTPLAPSSIRQVHAVLSGALSAAVRWGWIGVNPVEAAIKPRTPAPRPNPPSSEQAAAITAAAWEQDEDWGTFVWLTFVTGARRGELVGLRWRDFDPAAGILTIERSVVRGNGELVVKDTKTHQMRRISLDDTTVDILKEHKARYDDRCAEAARMPSPQAYVCLLARARPLSALRPGWGQPPLHENGGQTWHQDAPSRAPPLQRYGTSNEQSCSRCIIRQIS